MIELTDCGIEPAIMVGDRAGAIDVEWRAILFCHVRQIDVLALQMAVAVVE